MSPIHTTHSCLKGGGGGGDFIHIKYVYTLTQMYVRNGALLQLLPSLLVEGSTVKTHYFADDFPNFFFFFKKNFLFQRNNTFR